MTATWERVTSQGRLVYWRRHLADGEWLTVQRRENRWVWARRRVAVGLPGARSYVVDAGDRSTSRLARAAADAALTETS